MISGSPRGRLAGDDCERDWIWDREVETASPEAAFARAAVAWERQQRHLLDNSEFYARRLGRTPVSLDQLHRLPLTSKDDLKHAIDERPPFGSHLAVPETEV